MYPSALSESAIVEHSWLVDCELVSYYRAIAETCSALGLNLNPFWLYWFAEGLFLFEISFTVVRVLQDWFCWGMSKITHAHLRKPMHYILLEQQKEVSYFRAGQLINIVLSKEQFDSLHLGWGCLLLSYFKLVLILVNWSSVILKGGIQAITDYHCRSTFSLFQGCFKALSL